ncbi:MAG: phytoene/squalene synthase family protein [Chloroflexota bacterium]
MAVRCGHHWSPTTVSRDDVVGAPPTAADLAAAYASCAAIIRNKAHSFHLATRFLPAEKRRAVIVLYAFYRTVDDLCDEEAPTSPATATAALAGWRAWLAAGAPADERDPLRYLLGGVIARYGVPTRYLLELLDGVCSDLEPRRLRTFAELEHYCYQVAGTVGLVMAHVLGVRHARAYGAARDLGIAMQLTNIIRDVGEDLERGRLYLPEEDLRRFGCDPRCLEDGNADAAFSALLAFQIGRARAYYRRGLGGVADLSPKCQMPVALAGHLYQAILHKVELQHYDVFSRRARTTRVDKVVVAARVYLGVLPRRFSSSLRWRSAS